jgi:hypothetical protein
MSQEQNKATGTAIAKSEPQPATKPENKANNTPAPKTATPPAPAPAKVEEEKKAPKLNADSFSEWKSNETSRSKDEERYEEPVKEHEARGKRESDGYYFARKFAFDVVGKEFRTPQANLDLLTTELNKQLPKDGRIARTVYVARTFELRFFLANATSGSFVAARVNRAVNVNQFLTKIGLPPRQEKAATA